MHKILIKATVGLLAALVAIAPIQAAAQYEQPIINTPFSQAVANIPVKKDYVFGSSAVAGTGQIAITNSTQLGTYFNPYEVNTGTITTNSEWERYQPFSSAANFVFNSNNLQLTGTLTSGTHATVTGYGTIGNTNKSTNSFTASDCQMANFSAETVGQLFFQIFRGFYYVTSNDGTTITTLPLYGSSTSFGGFLPCVFPPAYYAVTNGTTAAGNGTLHFAAVPSGVVAGMTVGFQTSNTNQTSSQEYTVVSTTGTTVTITPVLASADAVSSGEGIFFLPGIHSGQIWTKDTYNMPGQNGATYFAMELTAQLPQHGNGYFDLSTANTNGAFGAWPAFWMRGDTTGGTDTYSELDAFELYDNAFRTMKLLDPNLINAQASGAINAIPSIADWLITPALWSIVGLTTGNLSINPIYTYNSATDFSLASHRYEVLLTPDKVFTFIDGVMIKSVPWHWVSPASPQVAVNLAIGSLNSGLGSNGQFPINDLNFPETLNIYELKIWGQ